MQREFLHQDLRPIHAATVLSLPWRKSLVFHVRDSCRRILFELGKMLARNPHVEQVVFRERKGEHHCLPKPKLFIISHNVNVRYESPPLSLSLSPRSPLLVVLVDLDRAK